MYTYINIYINIYISKDARVPVVLRRFGPKYVYPTFQKNILTHRFVLHYLSKTIAKAITF